MNNIGNASPFVARYAMLSLCGLLFVTIACTVTGFASSMFADTDPFWHLATGDLIREKGDIPLTDAWSFTAGNYRWLNISWLWDIGFSYLHEHSGWHAAFAVNAIIIALIIVLILANCALQSGSIFMALVTTASLLPLLSRNLRPLQITDLMTGAWMLLLVSVCNEKLSRRWLAALPFSMLLWVNMHGGFLVGGMLIAAFFAEAFYNRNKPLTRALFLTGIATLLAMLCNPYASDIFEAVTRPFNDAGTGLITEWRPFNASAHELVLKGYLIVFLFTAPYMRAPALRPVRLLSYFWLFLGLTSTRHLSIFAVISAPVTACGLRQLAVIYLPASALGFLTLCANRYNERPPAYIAAAACLATLLWLPTSSAAGAYQDQNPTIPDLNPEIAYIHQHLKNPRLLTDFDLAALLVYTTHGEIPVFVDPRTETAFPTQILTDYTRFLFAQTGWEAMLDDYKLDGVLISNANTMLIDRFLRKKDWNDAFTGPRCHLFIRVH